jgi:hypothetical protein
MTMNKVTSLSEARKVKEQAHAERVIKMFRDHPELAENAIILCPPSEGGDEGVSLVPEHMDMIMAVGILEAAKLGLLLSAVQHG